MGSNIVGDVSHLTLMELEDLGIGLNVALTWEEALHSALMPVTPQASMGSLSDSNNCIIHIKLYLYIYIVPLSWGTYQQTTVLQKQKRFITWVLQRFLPW